jgi:hypothetical protein
MHRRHVHTRTQIDMRLSNQFLCSERGQLEQFPSAPGRARRTEYFLIKTTNTPGDRRGRAHIDKSLTAYAICERVLCARIYTG